MWGAWAGPGATRVGSGSSACLGPRELPASQAPAPLLREELLSLHTAVLPCSTSRFLGCLPTGLAGAMSPEMLAAALQWGKVKLRMGAPAWWVCGSGHLEEPCRHFPQEQWTTVVRDWNILV